MNGSTTQSIPDSTNTALVFDDVFFDHGGYWNVASPTRSTVPVARGGLYNLGAPAHLQSSPSTVAGNRGLYSVHNGSDGLATTSQHVIGNDVSLTCSTVRGLQDGDYIEGFLNQGSDAALDCDAL